MKNERSISDSIALVERRLEVRRERMDRHLLELRETVSRSRKWIPYIAGVIALGVGGFAAARNGMSRQRVKTVAARTAPRASIAATVLAIVGTAVRFALSAQGRALWQAWRSRSATAARSERPAMR